MTRLIALLLMPVFCAAFLLLQVQSAVAAPIDAKGAAHLKTVFTQYLENQQSAARGQGRDLRAEGPVLVEPAGNYYAITMPHLTIVNHDGSSTDIGILAVNALPGTKDGEWKMTIAVPTPIMGYDAQKKPTLRIDIGGQSFSGLWNEKVGNFVKLDARYQNITALQSAEGVTVKIPSTSILYDLAPSADGKTWSGPAKYVMDNITITKAGDPGVSKIGRLAMDMKIHDYNPDEVRAYREKINALVETSTAPAVATMSNEHAQGLYNLVFDFISNVWDGFDSTVTVTDVDLSRPALAGGEPGRLALKQAGFTLNAKGFRTDSVTMNIMTKYDGLSLVPAPAGFDEGTPSRLNLDVNINKLPFKELVRLGREGMKAASTQPDGGKIAGMQAAELIPKLLTQAGTNLKVTQSFFGNNTYNVQIDGLLNANLAAVMGAEGKAKLDITGLEKLIALVKAKVKDPALNADLKARLNKSLITLTILQMTGQQGVDAQGQPMRSYNLELTNDGKIMINGADLSMLQALAGAGKPK